MKMQKTTIAAVIILTSGVLLSQDRFDFKVRNYFSQVSRATPLRFRRE